MMTRLQSPAIVGLAAQLLRGPGRLRLRQLLGIEFLLSVIEPDRSYPYDFVCHAITGYRPRSDGRESRLLAGRPLREDLVLLAEQLSADVSPLAAAWPERVFTVAELAERFDVSTKTIFRWHRRGLVGWRFRFGDGRARLAFADRCVRRFVAENADMVARGRAFSQLSSAERTAIVTRAQELVAAGEKTVNAVAKRISAEGSRAVETIRLILRQYDDAHPRSGVFNRSHLAVEPGDQRLAVWEAYCDGASLESLARRFERTTAWVYRTITEMRARDLKSRAVEYVRSDEFDAPDAEQRVLADPALAQPHQPTDRRVRVPADLPPYLQQLFHLPLLTAEGERALFRKMNYLRHRADVLRQQIDPETATAAQLDRIDNLLSDAQRVKNQLTQANLRLVVSIAKRHASPHTDFFEIVSDGNISLMRAVDKFDYSRGFKFSTYCSWAIMKNFARTVPEQRHRRERFQTGREELLDSVAAQGPDDAGSEHLPAMRATVDRLLDTLDERERLIIRRRFGLDGPGEPETLEQIGRRLGVSKERVRQLEARAFARLRSDFSIDVSSLIAG